MGQVKFHTLLLVSFLFFSFTTLQYQGVKKRTSTKNFSGPKATYLSGLEGSTLRSLGHKWTDILQVEGNTLISDHCKQSYDLTLNHNETQDFLERHYEVEVRGSLDGLVLPGCLPLGKQYCSLLFIPQDHLQFYKSVHISCEGTDFFHSYQVKNDSKSTPLFHYPFFKKSVRYLEIQGLDMEVIRLHGSTLSDFKCQKDYQLELPKNSAHKSTGDINLIAQETSPGQGCLPKGKHLCNYTFSPSLEDPMYFTLTCNDSQYHKMYRYQE